MLLALSTRDSKEPLLDLGEEKGLSAGPRTESRCVGRALAEYHPVGGSKIRELIYTYRTSSK